MIDNQIKLVSEESSSFDRLRVVMKSKGNIFTTYVEDMRNANKFWITNFDTLSGAIIDYEEKCKNYQLKPIREKAILDI